MNNLLFVFLEQLENEEELDKIIDKFSENNYIKIKYDEKQ